MRDKKHESPDLGTHPPAKEHTCTSSYKNPFLVTFLIPQLMCMVPLLGDKASGAVEEDEAERRSSGSEDSVVKTPAHFPGTVRGPGAGGVLYQQQPAWGPTNGKPHCGRRAVTRGGVGLQTVDEVWAARGRQGRSENPDPIQAANATGDHGLSSQAAQSFLRTPLCL